MKIDAKDSLIPFERVTVLGGLGFMGSHVCRELINRGHAVRIFDKVGASDVQVKDFESHVEIRGGDVSRPDDVLNAISDTDVVINLIHTTVPGSSMKDPSFDITSNVVAAAAWLQRLGQTRVRKILYVSSGGTVYGVPEIVPITEDHPTNPICSYGITKLAIEKYTAMYAKIFDVDYCLLRPSNVYGPGQQLHIGQGVVGVLANRALNGERLDVWGSGDDQRDYLFIDDFVRAVMALVVYQGSQRVFNVSSGRGHSVNEILSILRKQLTTFPEVAHVQERGFDVPVNVLDRSRIRAETDWQPSVDLEAGIARTVEWLKKQT